VLDRPDVLERAERDLIGELDVAVLQCLDDPDERQTISARSRSGPMTPAGSTGAQARSRSFPTRVSESRVTRARHCSFSLRAATGRVRAVTLGIHQGSHRPGVRTRPC